MRWPGAQRRSAISRSVTALRNRGWAPVGLHIFSPTVVMEVTSGVRHNHEAWYPYGGQADLDKVLRPAVGFNAGQWYPQANPQGHYSALFLWGTGGALPNPPNVNFDDRLLTGGADFTFSLNDNLTVTLGTTRSKGAYPFIVCVLTRASEAHSAGRLISSAMPTILSIRIMRFSTRPWAISILIRNRTPAMAPTNGRP